jgi:iron complex outermembrane receptor protein
MPQSLTETLLTGLCGLLPLTAFSQSKQDTLVPLTGVPVEITASRLTISATDAPLAVFVLDRARLQTATQQLSPYEALSAVPGVFAMNPDNYAQDLRISIRGFGARASFGIRGIRVFTDGLPEGTPDGQVDVDNLDMGAMKQMEVIRGAASGLYGNAAGGVIWLTTETPEAGKLLLEAQTVVGSYGFQRSQVKAGRRIGRWSYLLTGSHNQTTGYRDWSRMENTIFNGKLVRELKTGGKITLLANYGNSPVANDPGGLTAAQLEENPRQAGFNNLKYDTGEAVEQWRAGLTFEQKIGQNHQVQVRTFHTSRHLENRLAVASNGYGDLQRQYQGLYLGYQFTHQIGDMPYRFKLGTDLDNQSDRRKRYAYTETQPGVFDRGNLVLDQRERYQSAGAYLLQELRPSERLLLEAGIRFDGLFLRATDLYLTDGDQSGNRKLHKFNPVLGINYRISSGAALYANYATTFESPTLNELSNNPDGTGGFNPYLQPQEARSFEIGTKGAIFTGKNEKDLRFDLALFYISTLNDLVPYQIMDQPGKTYFRNAGKTDRRGVELGISWPLHKNLRAYYTQTISDFRYRTYTAGGNIYDGNKLPGIPPLNAQLEFRYFHPAGFFAIAQGRYAGVIFADDANSFFADEYILMNIRAGYTIRLKNSNLEPYVGVNNPGNEQYAANVQLNASGGRYYEAGTGRYWWAGVKFSLR